DFQFCEGHRFIPRTTVDQQVAAARQRADQAEAQLRAMQNSRAWRAVQKLRKVLRRA
ncbi:MAG: FkbM family methyltransferase, partial [Pseudomonas mandelii]